jgi:hypothetical protein
VLDQQTTVPARIDGREVKSCVSCFGTRFEDVRHERQVLFPLKRLLGREIAEHEHDERRLARTLVMVPCRAPTKKGGSSGASPGATS